MTAEPYYEDDMLRLFHGDARDLATVLGPQSVQTIVTSPPYWGLRDYGMDGQLGAEQSLHDYVAALVDVFAALRPTLSDDGTLWLNLGDSYSGSWGAQGKSEANLGLHKKLVDAGAYNRQRVKQGSRREGEPAAKNLIGIPWRVALALQEDGWFLRSDIIWAKPNPMPSSVLDRPTSSHEHIFLLSKSPRYFYNAEAISEPVSSATVARLGQLGLDEQVGSSRANAGARRSRTMKALPPRFGGEKYAEGNSSPNSGNDYVDQTGRANKRDVWTVATVPFAEAHFAVYPPELVRPCILAGSRAGDTVLDPFSGSGTTGKVAIDHGRRYVGFDLNSEYLDLSLRTRFAQPSLGVEIGL